MGDYAKALHYYEKDLAICQSTLPSNHPDIATSYNNIAWVYRGKKDFKQALDYYERALGVWEKTLPPTHHNIADVRKSIELVKGTI